jgi:hypothetical protein
VPEILGVGLPAINIGKTQNQGFDGQIAYHNAIGKVQYNAGFVFSYAKNKILFESEPSPAYPWLARTGHSIGQPFGYHFIGYYTAADVTDPKVAKPDNGIAVQPGDLKYQDVNRDGVINIYDQHPGLNPGGAIQGFQHQRIVPGIV